MREPNIHLEKVSDDNVDAIVKLRVSKEQRNYVASNNWSLIDAYLSLAEGKPYYYIWRFMIDKRFQRRGYGKEALKLAADFIRTFPCGEAEYCVLSYEPSNEATETYG